MAQKKSSGRTVLAVVLVVIALLLVAFLVLNLAGVVGGNPTIEPESVTMDVPEPTEPITEAGYTEASASYTEEGINQVLKDSKEDASAAVEKYVGSAMTFTATVKATDDAVGYIDLTPSTGEYAGETIPCNVSDGTDEKLMKLVNARSVGDRVTVSGKFQKDSAGNLRFYIDTMKVS